MKELDKNIKRKYSFSDYDPNWVIQFNNLKIFLIEVFGDKAWRIEHVGSTSIPGMKAKPIIDALVIVEEMENFEHQKGVMTKEGYEWAENYIAPNTLLFYKLGNEGEKFQNIHVCRKDNPKVKQFIVMRNFFRNFPEKAKEYAELKQKNFEKYPDDYPAYRGAKTSFLDGIEIEAYQWEESKNSK